MRQMNAERLSRIHDFMLEHAPHMISIEMEEGQRRSTSDEEAAGGPEREGVPLLSLPPHPTAAARRERRPLIRGLAPQTHQMGLPISEIHMAAARRAPPLSHGNGGLTEDAVRVLFSTEFSTG